jgi:ribosomal protein S18 acetylase RimI-like enzyme
MIFRLLARENQSVVAAVSFWDVEPLASNWGLRTAGMVDLYVQPEMRRRGLATYLLVEALKQLRSRGVTLVEAHTMHLNQPALSLYGKLGFCAVDCGYVFRKE